MTDQVTPRVLRGWMEPFRYDGPVGDGPGCWHVEVVVADPFHEMKYAMQGRPSGDGPFNVLRHNGRLWMSDTDAEIRDHSQPVYQTKKRVNEQGECSVLIHGLGMGLVAAACLRSGASVDVVELHGDLVEWMRPWLEELAEEHGVGVSFHVADVFGKKWPVGSRWDVVWHDIWPEITEDNLPEMIRLHRSFGRRSDWQGSWARERIELERRRSGGWW